MSDGVTRTRRSLPGPVLATAVTAVALAAVWLVAVPRDVVCSAVHPPDPGCSPEQRVTTATVWTAVLLLVWAVTLLLARRHPGVRPSLLVAPTVAVALAAYVGTEFSTGFAMVLGDAAPTLGT